ncbi:molecular chaperone [Chryseobacterium chendengshani]|uniref:fimbrial biogenesis chaperone n=1 Tax=Chryseobacterium sp. LJ668 TaxID=2864040 RepID=UPI001C68F9D9|nr:molecular chaperone [Chryseobacterium sp. LJ668]MBW8522896.1 molecular chaperone [Chryseobacterium sp. LJ668]QYK16425.1 molecular chaperone [Chryseobacterium sp. LJ668]
MNKITFLFYFLVIQISAQTGISVSPPRVYFDSGSGSSSTQKITVTNVSTKNSLDLAVSLGDWQYDQYGENMMHAANTLKNSCASWISVKKSDNYFTLAPGERKELDVTITVPAIAKDTLSSHTALLYISQMNPVDDVDSKGANIKVSIRSGIKIFHKSAEAVTKKVEIKDLKFDKAKSNLALQFENQSSIWVDGKISTEIINTSTGKKVPVDDIVFYTLPGDLRKITIPMGSVLEKGSYNASVMIDYGDPSSLEIGELNFNYE